MLHVEQGGGTGWRGKGLEERGLEGIIGIRDAGAIDVLAGALVGFGAIAVIISTGMFVRFLGGGGWFFRCLHE